MVAFFIRADVGINTRCITRGVATPSAEVPGGTSEERKESGNLQKRHMTRRRRVEGGGLRKIEKTNKLTNIVVKGKGQK